MTVYGDGKQTRSFQYVSDLVLMHGFCLSFYMKKFQLFILYKLYSDNACKCSLFSSTFVLHKSVSILNFVCCRKFMFATFRSEEFTYL